MFSPAARARLELLDFLPLFPFLFVLLDLVCEFPQPAQRLRLPHDAGSGGVQVVGVWAPGGRCGPGWTG